MGVYTTTPRGRPYVNGAFYDIDQQGNILINPPSPSLNPLTHTLLLLARHVAGGPYGLGARVILEPVLDTNQTQPVLKYLEVRMEENLPYYPELV